jgi:hypothetical protein
MLFDTTLSDIALFACLAADGAGTVRSQTHTAQIFRAFSSNAKLLSASIATVTASDQLLSND